MSMDQLSLYIDLDEGQRADLETASRAAIAFAEAVREIAKFVDPFSDVHLELIDTTEGSLSLNTKIKFRQAGTVKEITLYTLIIVFVTYIAGTAANFTAEKAINWAWQSIFGEEETSISEKDKNYIIRGVSEALKARAGEQEIKRIYAELDKDHAVTGVGVSRQPGARPTVIVPKSEFAQRAGLKKTEEPRERKRKKVENTTLVLISPVLANDRKRKWKFRLGDKEFGAPIKDEYFMDAVFSGKHPILMKGNIHMRVRLETNSEYVEGVWVEKKHIIWKVLGVPGQYQGPQDSFSLDYGQDTGDKPTRRK